MITAPATELFVGGRRADLAQGLGHALLLDLADDLDALQLIVGIDARLYCREILDDAERKQRYQDLIVGCVEIGPGVAVARYA